jgi:catechol 2,3-dioxygenase-like lactoylglutathione lyase family enzyme
MFELKKIREIVVITANADEMADLFCNYGGWTQLLDQPVHDSVLDSWGEYLPHTATGREVLLHFMGLPYGQLRFIQLEGVPEQELMRPTSKIWDTGGIADIDIRMQDMDAVYNTLTDRGWYAASPPMPLPVTDFVLDECLICNPDGMMIALAKRHVPPIVLPEGRPLASHVYLSAMTVRDLKASTTFFVDQLGFKLVNEGLVVQFPPNSPNNFGVPLNFSDKFRFVLDLYSPDGSRDTMCESILIEGLTGYDRAERCVPPNRGILCYRVEVTHIEAYAEMLENKGIPFLLPMEIQFWNGIGRVQTFTVSSPDGAWVTFFE